MMLIRRRKMREKRNVIVFPFIVLVVITLVSGSYAQETEKININKASVQTLVKLKNVGPALAKRIIEFREKNGPFEKPEDIVNVKGIGPKTFELNKDLISVE